MCISILPPGRWRYCSGLFLLTIYRDDHWQSCILMGGGGNRKNIGSKLAYTHESVIFLHPSNFNCSMLRHCCENVLEKKMRNVTLHVTVHGVNKILHCPGTPDRNGRKLYLLRRCKPTYTYSHMCVSVH